MPYGLTYSYIYRTCLLSWVLRLPKKETSETGSPFLRRFQFFASLRFVGCVISQFLFCSGLTFSMKSGAFPSFSQTFPTFPSSSEVPPPSPHTSDLFLRWTCVQLCIVSRSVEMHPPKRARTPQSFLIPQAGRQDRMAGVRQGKSQHFKRFQDHREHS